MKHLVPILIATLALGCGADSGGPEPAETVTDTVTVADTFTETETVTDTVFDPAVDVATGPTEIPPGTHGQIPPDALPVPEFVATNHDGGVRGPDDLMGHPTVLWFFPFAGTPG